MITDSFIPAELAVAPNPLGVASHLKLVTVPIDAYTCFELWMPTSETLLHTEAMVLLGDRPRLEEICAKLVWLLGATVSDTGESSHLAPMHDWQMIESYLQQSGIGFDAIGITYIPQAIRPNDIQNGISIAWTLRPAGWRVSLLSFKPIGNGYQIYVQPTHLAISTARPVTKLVQSMAVGAVEL